MHQRRVTGPSRGGSHHHSGPCQPAPGALPEGGFGAEPVRGPRGADRRPHARHPAAAREIDRGNPAAPAVATAGRLVCFGTGDNGDKGVGIGLSLRAPRRILALVTWHFALRCYIVRGLGHHAPPCPNPATSARPASPSSR